jgi:predicted metal-dependent phosphoesterase TrpH
MHTQPPPSAACDLHLHTWYSDGRASSAYVLAQAQNLGLTTIALTDHDNMRGARTTPPFAGLPELHPGC